LLVSKGGNTLTQILKYPVSFHAWKFAAGFVLSVLATILLFHLFAEPLGKEPLGYTTVALTATLYIGAIMFLHRSILPYGGSLFLWPFEPRKSRNDWTIVRHPLKLLDVIFMAAATTTIVLLVFDMLPRAPHWQSAAFVISMSVMFMMTVILYGTRFLPEKIWIDKTVTISGSVTALIACITLGLQPM
jgi:hypothetical protein